MTSARNSITRITAQSNIYNTCAYSFNVGSGLVIEPAMEDTSRRRGTGKRQDTEELELGDSAAADAILFVNVEEQSWLPPRVAQRSADEAFFLRVARGSPEKVLSVESCCMCDLDFKRAWAQPAAVVIFQLAR